MDDKEDREVTLEEMRNTLWRNLDHARNDYNAFLNEHFSHFKNEPRITFREYYIDNMGLRIK
jgi:hypothetical protein